MKRYKLPGSRIGSHLESLGGDGGNSMGLLFNARSTVVRESFPRCDRKSLRLFTRRLHDLSLMCSHDFSWWETLTSDIGGYKKSLRRPSHSLRKGSRNNGPCPQWRGNLVTISKSRAGNYVAKIIPLLFNDLQY